MRAILVCIGLLPAIALGQENFGLSVSHSLPSFFVSQTLPDTDQDALFLAAGTVGDVNGDSKGDVITIESRTFPDPTPGAVAPLVEKDIVVRLGNGDGTFRLPKRFVATTYSTALGTTRFLSSPELGDLNGDGKLDIVFGYEGTRFMGGLFMMLGNGDGTFQTPVTLSTSLPIASTTLADVNRDGKLDIVIAGEAVAVLLNNGDGSFTTTTTFGVPPQGFQQKIAVLDLNDDANPDLLILPAGATEVQVMLGNGDGTFGSLARFPIASGGFLQTVAVHIEHGDDRPAIVVGGISGGWILRIHSHAALANLISAVQFTTRPIGALALGKIAGQLSIVATTSLNNVAVFPMIGKSNVGPESLFGGGSGHIALADLNGDGNLDIVTGTAVLLQSIFGNLLKNGDFEKGDLSGYEDLGGIEVTADAAYSGSFGAKMNGNGRIDQRFRTTPGKKYEMTGLVRLDEETVSPPWGGVRVQVADDNWQELGVSRNLTAREGIQTGVWVVIKIVFKATTPRARIVFQNFSPGVFQASADNFEVHEVSPF